MGSSFDAAMEVLKDFDARYKRLQQLRRSTANSDTEIEEFDRLLQEFALVNPSRWGAAPTFDGPFLAWCSECFELAEIGHVDEARQPAARLAMAVVNGEAEAEEFFVAFEAYKERIQRVLDACAPVKFRYQGFEIYNPEHMGELRCRHLLEGIDYVVALFKRRGVTSILRDTVSRVTLAPKLSGAGEGTAHGLYSAHNREISLSAAAIGSGSTKFLKHWVNEVFLHEVGHHVHMAYLSPGARQQWDSGWIDINRSKQLFRAISHPERVKFFELLTKGAWDVPGVARKLKGIQKIKFGAWLRSPMVGEPLITPKQFKLTKHGQEVFGFLRNPAAYMKDVYDVTAGDADFSVKLERKAKQTASKLGLAYAGDFSIPSAVIDEMVAADPAIAKAVDDAVAKLEIVSDYGKTNEKEDFAETFVAFMDAPEKLTPTAKFRMQRALSLSGLYGKQVMRLARRVLVRFDQASLRRHYAVSAGVDRRTNT